MWVMSMGNIALQDRGQVRWEEIGKERGRKKNEGRKKKEERVKEEKEGRKRKFLLKCDEKRFYYFPAFKKKKADLL